MAEDRNHLDKAMNRRRAWLRRTWTQVAERGGVNAATLYRARRTDEPITEDTKAAIEQGLDWQPGSVDAVLAGGFPKTLEEVPSLGQPQRPIREVIGDIKASLAVTLEMLRDLEERTGDDEGGRRAG